MPPSGLSLSLLSISALALAAGAAQTGSRAFGHEGHWGAAGAGILLVAGTGRARKVLVLLRSEDVTEPGLWNLAGGAVDRNEDPLEAGLRELDEETGLRFSPGVARDHLLGQTVWHSPNGRFRYTTSVVEAPASIVKREIELNWENDDYKWVSAAWLRSHEEELHPGFRAKLDELIALAFGSASGGSSREPALTGSSDLQGTRGSRAKAKAKEPMMLCPRCSGSTRVWVGTLNPDPRSQERDSSRSLVHRGTYSGWSGCPVCTHGHVPVSVHDKLVGKARGSRGTSGEEPVLTGGSDPGQTFQPPWKPTVVRTYFAAGPQDPATLRYSLEYLSVCRAHDPLFLKNRHLYHSTTGNTFTSLVSGPRGQWHSDACDVCTGVHLQGATRGAR